MISVRTGELEVLSSKKKLCGALFRALGAKLGTLGLFCQVHLVSRYFI